MWRIYRFCAFAVFLASSAVNASADDGLGKSEADIELQRAFDPASVLDPETGADRSLELADLSGYALKSAAFVLLLIVSLVSILLWNVTKRASTRQTASSASLRVADSLSVGPGVTVKVLETGGSRIAVGYDRQGLKGMLLLQGGFDGVLDDAESDLISQTIGQLPVNDTRHGGTSHKAKRGDRTVGRWNQRQTTTHQKRAREPRELGWELDRLTT